MKYLVFIFLLSLKDFGVLCGSHAKIRVPPTSPEEVQCTSGPNVEIAYGFLIGKASAFITHKYDEEWIIISQVVEPWFIGTPFHSKRFIPQ